MEATPSGVHLRGLLPLLLLVGAFGHNRLSVGISSNAAIANAARELLSDNDEFMDRDALSNKDSTAESWFKDLAVGSSVLEYKDLKEATSVWFAAQQEAERLAAAEGAKDEEEEKCTGNCLTFHVPYTADTEVGVCNKELFEFAACANLHPKPRVRESPIAYCGPNNRDYKTHYHYFVHSMLLSPALEKRTGVKLVQTDDPFTADIVVCDVDGLQAFEDDPRRVRDGKIQYVLGVDHKDSGSASITEGNLTRPNLLAVAKQYTLKNHEMYCSCAGTEHCLVDERNHGIPPHLLLLRLLMSSSSSPSPRRLSRSRATHLLDAEGCGPSSMDKILPIIPFWLTVRRGANFPPLVALPTTAQRRIDAAFLGYMRDGVKAGEIYFHRNGLVEELRRIGERHGWNIAIGEGRMQRSHFEQLLRDTKLFISPFGLGEWSGKDEEAILNGAVLVKPWAKMLVSAIPIYKHLETCLAVRPDWANLEATMVRALSDPAKLDLIRQNAHEQASRFVGYAKATSDTAMVESWAGLVMAAKRSPSRRAVAFRKGRHAAVELQTAEEATE